LPSKEELLERIERLEKLVAPEKLERLEKLEPEKLEQLDRFEELESKVDEIKDKSLVVGGKEAISLTLNGQISSQLRFASDGTESQVQVVDNDTSSSRFRILGKGKLNDRFSVNTTIETDLEVLPSDEADIRNNTTSGEQVSADANFELRKIEFAVVDKKLGTLSLGVGNTASNTIAERDLSKTAAASDFTFDDDGLDFSLSNGELAGVDVGDFVNIPDGLSRDQRVRYDTPSFHGFSGAASFVTDGRWDVAARYRAKDLSGFAVDAARSMQQRVSHATSTTTIRTSVT